MKARRVSISVGVLLARARDPDPVIGEREMQAGNLGLWHVTGDAVLFRDGARLGRPCGRRMAGLALRVIMRNLFCRSPVGIVTRRAGDAPVGEVIAFAAGQPIELVTDIADSAR